MSQIEPSMSSNDIGGACTGTFTSHIQKGLSCSKRNKISRSKTLTDIFKSRSKWSTKHNDSNEEKVSCFIPEYKLTDHSRNKFWNYKFERSDHKNSGYQSSGSNPFQSTGRHN